MKDNMNDTQRGEKGSKIALIFLIIAISLGLLALAAKGAGLLP